MTDIALPLVWNGSKLSIPQASATQDGYLSHDDFILFSGGTVVPVTSFNTRTGEVVLLEDDVLAALGYVPLNKHGDTMTGPLTLAGPPTAALHAATKAFVESHTGGTGSGLLPGEYLVSDFGASGSALKFTGSITSGSTTLTTTLASDFATGHGIYVAGAGASGAALVTAVTAVSGTAITLQNAAVTTVTARNVQHDDTAAIQDAIDTVWATGGGKILFGSGFYRINRGFSDFNSILKVPIQSYANPSKVIWLCGVVNPFITYIGPPSNDTGVVIHTDLVGPNADSSMIAGATWVDSPSGWTSFNNTFLYISDMVWRTYDNPQISGIDFGMMGIKAFAVNVGVDTGSSPQGNFPPQPTHGTFGIRFPQNNASGLGNSQNSEVVGFGVGVIVSECFNSVYTTTVHCAVGVKVRRGHHLTSGRFLIAQCPCFVEVDTAGATHPTPIDFVIDIEEAPSGDWAAATPGRDFYDPANAAVGKIEYVIVLGGTGTLRSASTTGMANVSLVNLGTPRADTLAGNLVVSGTARTGNSTVHGTLSVYDGLMDEPVTFGAADSAGTGFRRLQVPNVSTSPLLTGLVSYWKHNESSGASLDSFGTNHLAVSGTITAEAGKIGNGRRSTAGSGDLYITDNASLDFSANKSITINGWLNIADLTAYQFPCLLSKWDGPLQFLLIYNGAAGQWQFSVSADGAGNVDAVIPATPTLNTWYMLTGIFNFSTGHISLQLNAGTAVTVPFAGPIFHSTSAMHSLLFTTTPIRSDAGVDEVGIWTRVLTSTEISNLYAGGAGLTFPF